MPKLVYKCQTCNHDIFKCMIHPLNGMSLINRFQRTILVNHVTLKHLVVVTIE